MLMLLMLNIINEYRRLNKEIFRDQLPENIILKWNNSKTCLGKTKIQMTGEGDYSFTIYISRFFICTDKEYIETLIHEMIHVLMAAKGEFKMDKRVHGPQFCCYMNSINRQFPQYNIKVKEDKKLEIDQSKVALQHGFFLVLDDNRKYFNLYNKRIDEKMIKTIISHLTSAFRKSNGELYTFHGRYPEIATAPVRKTLKTVSCKLQFLQDNMEMEILHNKIRNDSHNCYQIGRHQSIFKRISNKAHNIFI